MKQSEPLTPVRFLTDKPDREYGSVFAYFPYMDYNFDLYGHDYKSCYARVGQHGKCAKDYAKGCKEATPEEYESLRRELEDDIGYRLKVLNRASPTERSAK